MNALGPRIVGLLTPVLSLMVKMRVTLALAEFNSTLVFNVVGMVVIAPVVCAFTLMCSMVKSFLPK